MNTTQRIKFFGLHFAIRGGQNMIIEKKKQKTNPDDTVPHFSIGPSLVAEPKRSLWPVNI